MKLKTLMTGLTLAATTALITLPSQASVTYNGDPQAAAVCKAIVEDDTAALDQAFRKADSAFRRTKFVGDIEQTFLCNDKPLAEFAAQMGAYAVLSELDGDAAGQVASTH